MTRVISDRARELAADLERLFAGDAELAQRLNDAHGRLLAANERLWTGLAPTEASAIINYTHQPTDGGSTSSRRAGASASRRSQQEAHWAIHKAHGDYQEVAEGSPALGR
jgi:hypothetical protein